MVSRWCASRTATSHSRGQAVASVHSGTKKERFTVSVWRRDAYHDSVLFRLKHTAPELAYPRPVQGRARRRCGRRGSSPDVIARDDLWAKCGDGDD